MKKLVSVLLIIVMLFGAAYAEKDMFEALEYQEAYEQLEGYTQQMMEMMWEMLNVMNIQIESGMELTDAEIDLYFKYVFAILHMDNVKTAQSLLWIYVTGYKDEFLDASLDKNDLLISSFEGYRETWKDGDNDAFIYSALETMSKCVELKVYPERAAEILGK